LTEIFSDGYQYKLRQQQSAGETEQIWAARLGDNIHNEAKRVASWIGCKPQRDDILSFINGAASKPPTP